MAHLVVQEPEERAEERRHKEQIGQVEAVGVADAAGDELNVALLEAADGLRVGRHEAEAVDDGLGAQRGDEGRDLELRDDDAVEQAQAGADGDDDQQHEEHVHFRQLGQTAGIVGALDQDAGEAGGQTGLTAGGQVCALGDEAAGDAERDQEADRGVAHQVAEVFPGEEVVLRDADDDRHDDEHDDDRVGLDIGQEFLPKAIFVVHIPSSDYSNCVASAMMFSWLASLPSMTPVIRPSHMTMIRSDMPISSPISEEIMMMLLPCLARSAMMQ